MDETCIECIATCVEFDGFFPDCEECPRKKSTEQSNVTI